MLSLRCIPPCLAGALLVCGAPAFAAEIKGTITDAAGGALASARVTLENVATGAQSVTASDGNGHYSFSSVAVGIYRVSASVVGFSQDARTVSLASDAESLDLSFALSVGNLTTTVTVTATRSARDTLEIPLRAESIGPAQLQITNPASTGDAMVQAPGITPVANGPFQVRPRLRGLDSTRVLILVDGERLNNARTATDRAGVEVGLVDESSVESVEVVSGSGSVLYGTDALSGTINIITTQPRFTEELHVSGGLDGYFSSNEDGRRGTATLGVSGKRFALRVSGALEKFDDYHSGGKDGDVLEDTRPLFSGPCPGKEVGPCLTRTDTIDTFFAPLAFAAFPDPFNAPYVRTSTVVPSSSSKGSNVNATGYVSLTDNQTLRVKYIRRRAEDIGFPDFTPPQFFQGIVLPFSDLDKVTGRYQVRGINSWFSALTATVYYQKQDRKLQNIDIPVQFPAPTARTFFPINVFRLVINSSTEQKVETWGFDLQNNFLLSPKNVLTAGFTFYRDQSADERSSSTQFNLVGQVALGARGPAAIVFPSLIALGPPTLTKPVRVPNATFRDFGVFAQDEWDLTPKLKAVAGVRFDAYDVGVDETPGYSVASLTTGARPPIDPSTLPNLSGDSISRNAFTGDVGLVLKASEKVSVVGHYGRSYRHPNLEELLFSGPATIGNIVPNVKVGPEKGDNFDFGIKVRSGRFAGSLSYFNNKYDGFISTEIVAVGCCGLPTNDPSSSVSQAINFLDVRIQGVEADLDAPFALGSALLTVFGNGAYNHGQVLRGRNALTGESLADTPQDNITPLKIIGGVRLSDKQSRFWAEYSLRYQKKVERVAPTLIDSPFLIAQDLFGLNGFTLHRVAAGVEWKVEKDYSLGLTLAVENLGNKYYREQFQFAPARGRSFTVGLRLHKL